MEGVTLETTWITKVKIWLWKGLGWATSKLSKLLKCSPRQQNSILKIRLHLKLPSFEFSYEKIHATGKGIESSAVHHDLQPKELTENKIASKALIDKSNDGKSR
ncbi:MAG: hypothetical protein KF824_03865 [Fimbriimonadaceae bacterium]|nr:MAG: hypothetical protein KF824_03865 [Fimbriimonadaceae bacterium]